MVGSLPLLEFHQLDQLLEGPDSVGFGARWPSQQGAPVVTGPVVADARVARLSLLFGDGARSRSRKTVSQSLVGHRRQVSGIGDPWVLRFDPCPL